jgi:hypothetical protein
MFGVVEGWWRSKQQYEQQELRQQLSRDGVMNGLNHKEGVHDTGHGCGKPLGMAKSSRATSGTPGGFLLSGISEALGGGEHGSGVGFGGGFDNNMGGGALGGVVGALAGGLGGSLLSGILGEDKEPKPQAYVSQGYTPQGGYQQQYTEVAHGGNQYAQAQFSETQLPGGGRQTDYQRYQQSGTGRAAGFEQRTETQPTYGGGYEQTNERVYQQPGGNVKTETWREGQTADGRHYREAQVHEEEHSDSDDSERRRHGRHHRKSHHGSGNVDFNDRPQQYQPPGGGFGERERLEEVRRENYDGRGGFGGGFGSRGEGFRERLEERREDLEGAVRSSESVWKKGTKCLKREEKASGAEVDMVVASGNLLVRDSRSVGRNSAVEDSEADTKSLLERNMVVVVSAMKADGARGRGSRRSTEKRLLRSEKRSVRKNTERKDVRRVVVDGSTELVEAM